MNKEDNLLILISTKQQLRLFPISHSFPSNSSFNLGFINDDLLSCISDYKALWLTCHSCVALSSILQFFLSAPAVRQQVIDCDWLPSFYHHHYLFFYFYFISRWHCTFPFIFTHNICVCCSHPVLLQTWRKVFQTVIPVFIPSCLLGENLWVSNWSERVCVARSDRMWVLNLMLLTYALAMCYGFCILQQQASTVLTITGLALNSR